MSYKEIMHCTIDILLALEGLTVVCIVHDHMISTFARTRITSRDRRLIGVYYSKDLVSTNHAYI
jgi:hypothetical protein